MSARKSPDCYRCWIPNCRNSRIANKVASGVKVFSFPVSDLPRCRKWLQVVGWEELLDIPVATLKSRTICSAHFNSSDIRKGLKRCDLVTGAVPSVFEPPRTPLSDELVAAWPHQENHASERVIVKFTPSPQRQRPGQAASTLQPLLESNCNINPQTPSTSAVTPTSASVQLRSTEKSSGGAAAALVPAEHSQGFQFPPSAFLLGTRAQNMPSQWSGCA